MNYYEQLYVRRSKLGELLESAIDWVILRKRMEDRIRSL